jgi:hypothetical protein
MFSVKYPIQLGMPNPKDTPKRRDNIKTFGMYVGSTAIEMTEDIIPNIIQIVRNRVLSPTFFANDAPAMAENTIPAKWILHINIVVKWSIAVTLTISYRILMAR